MKITQRTITSVLTQSFVCHRRMIKAVNKLSKSSELCQIIALGASLSTIGKTCAFNPLTCTCTCTVVVLVIYYATAATSAILT